MVGSELCHTAVGATSPVTVLSHQTRTFTRVIHKLRFFRKASPFSTEDLQVTSTDNFNTISVDSE